MIGDTDIKVIQQNVSIPNVNNQPVVGAHLGVCSDTFMLFAVFATFINDLNCVLFLPYPA